MRVVLARYRFSKTLGFSIKTWVLPRAYCYFSVARLLINPPPEADGFPGGGAGRGQKRRRSQRRNCQVVNNWNALSFRMKIVKQFFSAAATAGCITRDILLLPSFRPCPRELSRRRQGARPIIVHGRLHLAHPPPFWQVPLRPCDASKLHLLLTRRPSRGVFVDGDDNGDGDGEGLTSCLD